MITTGRLSCTGHKLRAPTDAAQRQGRQTWLVGLGGQQPQLRAVGACNKMNEHFWRHQGDREMSHLCCKSCCNDLKGGAQMTPPRKSVEKAQVGLPFYLLPWEASSSSSSQSISCFDTFTPQRKVHFDKGWTAFNGSNNVITAFAHLCPRQIEYERCHVSRGEKISLVFRA